MEWLRLVQCPVCRGDLRQQRPNAFDCNRCGTTYPRAGYVPDFLFTNGHAGNGLELDYDYHLRRHHGSHRRLYNSFRRPFELQLIKREVDKLGRLVDVLDVGCGDPFRPTSYHRRLFPLTRSYIGVEPSLPIVSRLNPASGVAVVRASGELRVVRDEIVDIAVCFGALDRCRDPDQVLANMAAALRPGGCIMIDLVNDGVWYRKASEGLRAALTRRAASGESRRRSKMSPSVLRQRLELAGFRDVDLHDLLYLARPLESRAVDMVVKLIGAQWWTAFLRQVDRVGRFIAPGRGGMFIALGRKPK